MRTVCSVPEEELDEFNIHVARHRPEELTKLAKTTKFSRKEIQLIYRGFKQVNPVEMISLVFQSWPCSRPVRL
jgi:hypothetical protein